MGTAGIILSSCFYAYCGMILVKLGSRLQTTSHREAIYVIGGKVFGTIIDYVIIFTMLGAGVAMIAASGSILNQQFGIPLWIGNTLMTILVLGTLMLKIDRIIIAIGFLTPVLIITLVIVCVYALLTMTDYFATLEPYALAVKTTLPNWFISSLNHVSFNVAIGAGMALVLGGAEINEKKAAIGGLLGGLMVGFIILLSHLALFSHIRTVANADMPLLLIADEVSPIFSLLMTLVVYGMIYNTAVSLFTFSLLVI